MHTSELGLDVRFLCSNMDCPVKVEVPETTGFDSHSFKAPLIP